MRQGVGQGSALQPWWQLQGDRGPEPAGAAMPEAAASAGAGSLAVLRVPAAEPRVRSRRDELPEVPQFASGHCSHLESSEACALCCPVILCCTQKPFNKSFPWNGLLSAA